MALENMNTDFLYLVTSPLSVFEKYDLSITSSTMRRVLRDFLEDWDVELAEHIAKSINEDNPSKGFRMKKYDKKEFDYLCLSSKKWNTTKMSIPPIMTLEPVQCCNAYDIVNMEYVNVEYLIYPMQDPTRDNIHKGKKIVCAHPILTKSVFEEIDTLKGVPVQEISWNVYHHKPVPNAAFYHGEPLLEEDDATVVYVRMHNVVSADVRTVNPRITFELMGVSMVNRSCYEYTTPDENVAENTLVYLKQLRLYIKKATDIEK